MNLYEVCAPAHIPAIHPIFRADRFCRKQNHINLILAIVNLILAIVNLILAIENFTIQITNKNIIFVVLNNLRPHYTESM